MKLSLSTTSFFRSAFCWWKIKNCSQGQRDQRLQEIETGKKLPLARSLRSISAFLFLLKIFHQNRNCNLLSHIKAQVLLKAGHDAQVDYGVMANAPPPEGHCRLLIEGKALYDDPEFISIRRVSTQREIWPWLLKLISENHEEAEKITKHWDWDFEIENITHTLNSKGLLPLVGSYLSKHKAYALPSAFCEEALEAHTRAAVKMDLFAELWKDLSKEFDKQEIKVLLFKGPALVTQLYEVGERDFCDLDLIVSNHQFEKVKSIISEQGFSPLSGHQRTYKGQGLMIDIHFKVSDLLGPVDCADQDSPFKIDMKELIKNKRSISLNIDTLDQEMETLIHAAHWVIRHGADDWIWALDLQALLKRFSNFSKLLSMAKESKLDRTLAAALEALEHLNLEVPGELKMNLPKVEVTLPAIGAKARAALWWKLIPDPSTRFMIVKRIICPSQEYLEDHYPSPAKQLKHWWRVVNPLKV